MLKDLDETDIYAIMQRENHFICPRCRKWKNRINIGEEFEQEFSISTSQLAKNMSGVLSKRERYICSSCKRKLARIKIVLWATLAVLVLFSIAQDFG